MRDVGIFAPIRNGGQADQEAQLNRIKRDIIDTEADIRAQRRIIEHQEARKNGIEESQEYKDLASGINEIKNYIPQANIAKRNASNRQEQAQKEKKDAEEVLETSWNKLFELAGAGITMIGAGFTAYRYFASGAIACPALVAGIGGAMYLISWTADNYNNERLRQAEAKYNDATRTYRICTRALEDAQENLDNATAEVVNYEGQERNYNQFQADINSCERQIQEANQEIQRLEGVLEELRQTENELETSLRQNAGQRAGNDRLVDQLAAGAA